MSRHRHNVLTTEKGIGVTEKDVDRLGIQSPTQRAARAFWLAEPGRGEIRHEDLPARAPQDLLVEARYGAISRGTEALVFSGRVPPSQHDAMRAPFQQGDFPAPVKYGYISVGTVLQGPQDRIGDTVFCLHPHQDLYVVPAEAALTVPETIPARRAVLAANMETAINGLWDAGAAIGDRIVIVGGGLVGCLVAALAARLPGTDVTLVDTDAGRATVATALGAGFASPDQADGEADLVIHASGNPKGLQTALTLAGFEATVLELSWFGDRVASLPLGEAFHAKRLTLKSSQVGHVPANRRAGWSRTRRQAKALELLADPVFDVLITDESAFEDLPATLPRLANDTSGALCHLIVYKP